LQNHFRPLSRQRPWGHAGTLRWRGARETAKPAADSYRVRFIDIVQPSTDLVQAHDLALNEQPDKLLVLFSPCSELADGEVVRFRADSDDAAGGRALNSDGAFAPWKDRGVLPDAGA